MYGVHQGSRSMLRCKCLSCRVARKQSFRRTTSEWHEWMIKAIGRKCGRDAAPLCRLEMTSRIAPDQYLIWRRRMTVATPGGLQHTEYTEYTEYACDSCLSSTSSWQDVGRFFFSWGEKHHQIVSVPPSMIHTKHAASDNWRVATWLKLMSLQR